MTKSNGSFITSNLAIASNVAYTDRILVVYNAIANSSIGAGNPQTRTIQVINLVSSISNSISLMAWSNAIAFSPGNISYNVSLTDCYVFVNSNNQGNCSVVLPSASANSKGFVIKKTNANTLDSIIISTDSNVCLIDNSNTFTMNSTVEFVKGNDGNFWIVGKI